MAMVGSITRGEVMGTPGTQIQWTDSEQHTDSNEEVDYLAIITNNAFQGDIPYETIIEGLEAQFIDYINIEDKTNFVDIFYDQLHASFEIVYSNDEEEHPAELIEALNNLQDDFINKIAELFEQRLTVTFIDLDNNNLDYNDVEFVLRRSYEFFILGARDNFKTVISSYIFPKVKDIVDDKEYFKMVRELVSSFNPLITSFGPIEFLQYRGEKEILEMYENGKIVGNFLRKYSPKLYDNEEYECEIINHITSIQAFSKDLNQSIYDSEPEERVYEYGENYEYEYEIGPYVD